MTTFSTKERFDTFISDMIERADRAGLKKLRELEKSAEERGLVSGRDYIDMCGGAYLRLSGRDPLVRTMKKWGHTRAKGDYDGDGWWLRKGVYGGYELSITVPSLRGRQEVTPQEEAMDAAQSYLKGFGYKTYVRSYLT